MQRRQLACAVAYVTRLHPALAAMKQAIAAGGNSDDYRRRLGIVEQISQFFRDISVVDVERRNPGLEGAEHCFQVFVAVVEVDADVVLAALVAGQVTSFGVAPEAPVGQRVGEAPCPVRDLAPGEPPIAKHETCLVGS